ncbi:MAG: polyprenyl synthetase family protein [Thioalkalivibrionaceae bacterium]
MAPLRATVTAHTTTLYALRGPHNAADEGELEARSRIETLLDQALAPSHVPRPAHRLIDAMRYATLGGGKRLRPMLTRAAVIALGDDAPDCALWSACAAAVELIHVYSLIHDDLPAMDDDDLRRGKPTCHRAFDDATAILAGDALQAVAFELLAKAFASAAVSDFLPIVQELAEAAGVRGMAGGQMIDLESEGRLIDLETLETLHRMKTGALIRAAVRMPALARRSDHALETRRARELAALTRYAEAIGLAFQIRDDLLDVEGNAEQLGKRAGADVALGKATFPSLIGIEASQFRLAALHAEACSAIELFEARGQVLRDLATRIVERNH